MVDVNDVYQKVLAISNKEQRGYITPQEFNLLADKAQLDIINSYFDDVKTAYHKPTKNQSGVGDEIEMLSEKLGYIRTTQTGTLTGTTPVVTLANDCYKVGVVEMSSPTLTNSRFVEVTRVTSKELRTMLSHPLLEPTGLRPIYIVQDALNAGALDLEIHTFGVNSTLNTLNVDETNNFRVEYYRRPTVVWGYVVVAGKALYNSNTSTNFSLHPSESESLITKILELAGTMLQRPDLTQAALTSKQMANQEKNN
jgi:hypothetical protein